MCIKIMVKTEIFSEFRYFMTKLFFVNKNVILQNLQFFFQKSPFFFSIHKNLKFLNKTLNCTIKVETPMTDFILFNFFYVGISGKVSLGNTNNCFIGKLTLVAWQLLSRASSWMDEMKLLISNWEIKVLQRRL